MSLKYLEDWLLCMNGSLSIDGGHIYFFVNKRIIKGNGSSLDLIQAICELMTFRSG